MTTTDQRAKIDAPQIKTVKAEGQWKGQFRTDLDVRIATLAILGMCNAASSWHRKENIDVGDIGKEFSRLVTDGMGKRPMLQRKRR